MSDSYLVGRAQVEDADDPVTLADLADQLYRLSADIDLVEHEVNCIVCSARCNSRVRV